MNPLSWEARDRLHLSPPHTTPPIKDDLTAIIELLERMLTEYHEKRPAHPLRRHY